MKKVSTGLLLLILAINALAQTGKIRGRIYNEQNNEPIPFANILIFQTDIGTVSDLEGNFSFTGLDPGFVKLRISAVGYETFISDDIMVTNAQKKFIDVALEEKSVQLDEVEVVASLFKRDAKSPVSLRRIGVAEIEKNPGGNRDISKVIQSFPGVASTVSFRNDLIVRGGGPGENAFYLDGIEIPNLNHFSTQGASGGPVGIINVDFISSVDYYSGAFPANRSGALSSVFEFKQKNGSQEKTNFRGAVGATDLGITLDGPLGDNTTYIFSLRRSYLQFLFSVIGLPFLPTYNDVQFKTRTRFDEKNELTILGIGALDQFELNTAANETEDQRYILRYLPVNEQWNYAIGANYKHYRDNGTDTWIVSRNHLNNIQYKYKDNNEDSAKTLDYSSQEIENKIRYERGINMNNGLKLNFGADLEHARYTNSTFRKDFIVDTLISINYNSELDLLKYGLFGQVSKSYFSDRLSLSLGVRLDANTFSDDMRQPLEQLSPRFSASYQLTPKWFINSNLGRYYQLPPYTSLGYRDQSAKLINKQNDIGYIKADHLVAGFEYLPNERSKLSLEGFYKWYNDYPFSLKDSVSIASKGGDFGTFGDEPLISAAQGRAYGIELLYRNRIYKKLTIVLSYTYVRSEAKDMDENLNQLNSYTPTAWDNKHLLNLTATRNFKNNWDVGLKWRFVGGSPYTPIDEYRSSFVTAWNAKGRPYLDYSRFNEKRLSPFHQLDIRIDKQYFFDKWSLMFYLDIQNFYNFKSEEPDRLTVEKEDGSIVDKINPGAPLPQQRYDLRRIESDGQGTVLPSIGVIVEF